MILCCSFILSYNLIFFLHIAMKAFILMSAFITLASFHSPDCDVIPRGNTSNHPTSLVIVVSHHLLSHPRILGIITSAYFFSDSVFHNLRNKLRIYETYYFINTGRNESTLPLSLGECPYCFTSNNSLGNQAWTQIVIHWPGKMNQMAYFIVRGSRREKR